MMKRILFLGYLFFARAALKLQPQKQLRVKTTKHGSILVQNSEDEISQSAHHFIPKSALKIIHRVLKNADYDRFLKLIVEHVTVDNNFTIPPTEKWINISINLFNGPASETRMNDPSFHLKEYPIFAPFKVDEWPISIIRDYHEHVRLMNDLWVTVQPVLLHFFSCHVEKSFMYYEPLKSQEKTNPEIEALFLSLENVFETWTRSFEMKISMDKKIAFPFNKEDWEPVNIGKAPSTVVRWILRRDTVVTSVALDDAHAPFYETSVLPEPRKEFYDLLDGNGKGYPSGYYLRNIDITNKVAVTSRYKVINNLLQLSKKIFDLYPRTNTQIRNVLKHSRYSLNICKIQERMAADLKEAFDNMIKNTLQDQCDALKIHEILERVPPYDAEPAAESIQRSANGDGGAAEPEAESIRRSADVDGGDDTVESCEKDVTPVSVKTAKKDKRTKVEAYQEGDEIDFWDQYLIEEEDEDYLSMQERVLGTIKKTANSIDGFRKSTPVDWQTQLISHFYALREPFFLFYYAHYDFDFFDDWMQKAIFNPSREVLDMRKFQDFPEAWEKDRLEYLDVKEQITRFGRNIKEIYVMLTFQMCYEIKFEDAYREISMFLRTLDSGLQVVRDFFLLKKTIRTIWAAPNMYSQNSDIGVIGYMKLRDLNASLVEQILTLVKQHSEGYMAADIKAKAAVAKSEAVVLKLAAEPEAVVSETAAATEAVVSETAAATAELEAVLSEAAAAVQLAAETAIAEGLHPDTFALWISHILKLKNVDFSEPEWDFNFTTIPFEIPKNLTVTKEKVQKWIDLAPSLKFQKEEDPYEASAYNILQYSKTQETSLNKEKSDLMFDDFLPCIRRYQHEISKLIPDFRPIKQALLFNGTYHDIVTILLPKYVVEGKELTFLELSFNVGMYFKCERQSYEQQIRAFLDEIFIPNPENYYERFWKYISKLCQLRAREKFQIGEKFSLNGDFNVEDVVAQLDKSRRGNKDLLKESVRREGAIRDLNHGYFHERGEKVVTLILRFQMTKEELRTMLRMRIVDGHNLYEEYMERFKV